jgi:hypothetical protein
MEMISCGSGTPTQSGTLGAMVVAVYVTTTTKGWLGKMTTKWSGGGQGLRLLSTVGGKGCGAIRGSICAQRDLLKQHVFLDVVEGVE